jgi:hypothetical protein
LEENIDSLIEICIQNSENKHLFSQSLNGFYQLLSFEKLIESSKILKSNTYSNYYSIAKCLWHFLWFKDNQYSEDRYFILKNFFKNF